MKFFSNLGNKKIVPIIVIFVIVSIGMTIFLYLNNPKIKFLRVLNNEYKSFMSLINKISNSDIAKLSGNTTLISNGNTTFDILLSDQFLDGFLDPLADVINDLSVDYEYASDPQNDNTYLKFNSTIDNEEFIKADMYQRGDKKYIYLYDSYDKYIESDSIEYVNKFNNQVEDIKYLFDKIKGSFADALKTTDFSHKTKQIDINNVVVYADKLTLTMTDKRIKEITKKILLDLKGDKNCLDILNRLSNSKEDSKVVIDKTIESLDEEKILPKDVKIDIYIQQNEIIKMEMFNGSIKTYEYLNYFTFYPVKEITHLDVNGIVYTILLEQKEENHLAYEIYSAKSQLTTKGSLTKTIKESTDMTFGVDVSLVIMISNQTDLLGTIKINTHTTTKIGEKVDKIDITDTIKEEEITEEEQTNIMSKFVEKLFNVLPIEPIHDGNEVL